MSKYLLAFSIMASIVCCQSLRAIKVKKEKLPKGIIIYYGDYFFLYKIKNQKLSNCNVTWPDLYANIEHTGYALNGIPSKSLDNLFDYFKGISLNVQSENVKNEYKYLYVVPVFYSLKFMDTTKYNPRKGRTFNIHVMHKEILYTDFNYKSYLVDTCGFFLWKDLHLSTDFNLPADSMLPLIRQLPPGIFKD